MPRARSKYICQQCGGQYASQYGRCPGCSAWGSLIETIDRPGNGKNGQSRVDGSSFRARPLASIESVAERRLLLPMHEFNRVLGGGIVPGSLVLLGGEPGIGKSTLLLQASTMLAEASGPVLYATGEESAEQVKLRADRLGHIADDVYVLPETDIDSIADHVTRMQPVLLIVDSIQTMHTAELESPAGSVGQVREATARLARLAKTEGIACILVGHVTKEGSIAGPKVLEHMVDTVLYLEGDQFRAYRLLRSVKNRFGSTHEVGVFDMRDEGLVEVQDPSAVFLSERDTDTSGSVVAVTLEGSRPLLVELQALVTPTHFGIPRRTTTGFDLNRLVLLTAVLTKRANLHLGNDDIYVNVAGGMRLTEPASDLATCLAIASSLANVPTSDVAAVGEVGLGGEIRSVKQLDRRVAESRKRGFARCIVPQRNLRDLNMADASGIIGVGSVQDALDAVGCGRG